MQEYKGLIGIIRLGYDLFFDYGHDISYYIYKNRIKDVEYLLKQGNANQININQINGGPITHNATSPEMLRLLVKYGADINSVQDSGMCILLFRCLCGKIDLFEECLRLGANPDKIHKIIGSVLMYCCSYTDKNIFIKLLLKYKANPNLIMDDEIDALVMAITNVNKEAIELLIEHDVIISSKHIILTMEPELINDINGQKILLILQKEFLKRIDFLPLPIDIKRYIMNY